MLTNIEVVQLKKVLVRDNHLVTGVHFVHNFVGRGGSNTYNMSRTEGIRLYSLSDLDGAAIRYANVNEDAYDYPRYLAIAAVVEDVVYVLEKHYTSIGGIQAVSSYTVTRLYPGEKLYDERTEVSYDTDWYFEMYPLCDEPAAEQTYVKPEEPTEEAYHKDITLHDLGCDRTVMLIERRRELMWEIEEFEWLDRTVLKLFCGWRHEYFDPFERAEELEAALAELREKGRITHWAGGRTSGLGSPAEDFDRQMRENPNRRAEFEALLVRGIPLYREMCALWTEMKKSGADEDDI